MLSGTDDIPTQRPQDSDASVRVDEAKVPGGYHGRDKEAVQEDEQGHYGYAYPVSLDKKDRHPAQDGHDLRGTFFKPLPTEVAFVPKVMFGADNESGDRGGE